MRTIKDGFLDRIAELVRFLRTHNKKINLVFKFSKIVVVVTLLYTSVIMYQLGNLLVGFMIMSVAVFYLILNKLDSII